MAAAHSDIIEDVAAYYSSALERHGPTARGVDWNGEESQALRFRELSRVIDHDSGFRVNDLGCGYGAYQDYLETRFSNYSYAGYDVSPEMIEAARGRLPHEDIRFTVASTPTDIADYGIASGIFNVCVGRDGPDWEAYLFSTLDAMADTSRRGFAFNCLTYYSDPERMREHLYYANPLQLFDHCKKRFSRNVALLHDYGLWEFTILVRKEL